jgi:hypothetical protein
MKAAYLALAVLCSSVIAPGAPAQQIARGVVEAEVTEKIVVVRAVDQQARSVTVEEPAGDLVTIRVPPQSQNLDQVYPGARFRVRYLQSVAVFLSKSGDAPSAEEATAVEFAEKGATPGGVIVDVRRIEARVDTVNYQDRTVMVTGPDGNQVKLSVDGRVQDFDSVKVGDMVVVRYTEALAMNMIRQ